MFFAKTYCGDEGEIMLEEVLKHGYIAASKVIIRIYKRIEQTPSKCMIQKYNILFYSAFLFFS